MSLEHKESVDLSSQKPASNEELLLVAEYLDSSGYEDLGGLLEDLAAMDETDVDDLIYDELSREFSRNMALMPENAEILSSALGMINLELSESSPSFFKNRLDFLDDLYNSPGKYFNREGNTLTVSQPGNSVKFTRIHDFIGPNSDVIPLGEPDNYELTHNDTLYSWSPNNETWEDVNGEPLKLNAPTEAILIKQKEHVYTGEEAYGAVWQAVQPQVGSDGVTRGGFVQIRNHLFMDHRENEEAEPGTRPDPVPRAYYYYGRNFNLQSSALQYTGQSPERHEDLAKIFRKGFVRAAPTAGGGTPTMEESGLDVLRDYDFLDKTMRGEVLDESYEESLAMANDYLDSFKEPNMEAIGSALKYKGRFDARIDSFLLRYDAMENTDTGLSPSMEGDLYDVHVNNILEDVRPYIKALNKLPKSFRDKYLREDIMPSMKMIIDLIPDEYSEPKKAMKVYQFQFKNSLDSNKKMA